MRKKTSVWVVFLTVFSGLTLAVESFGNHVVPNGTPGEITLEEEKNGIDKKTAELKKGVDMVLIPAGEFNMGVSGRTISLEAFYIDKYEVTQADFEQAMGSNPSNFKGSNLPVEEVTWHEADAYCRKTGKRLPTEAEWEKAAKGGKNGIYPWGDDKNDAGRYAWFDGNSDSMTHPAGQKEPNGYGLYDMAGNVWEWVADWYDKNYDKNAPKNDPRGPGSGEYKVLRGGSWGINLSNLRSSYRGRNEPAIRYPVNGFRCAATSFSP